LVLASRTADVILTATVAHAVKHWKVFFPVGQYAVSTALEQFQWLAMMVFEFVALGVCAGALGRLWRPPPTYLRVHRDTGEAYRMVDPPSEPSAPVSVSGPP